MYIYHNLIKNSSSLYISYEDLTVAHSRSCADDLCNFCLWGFHQLIKMLHTTFPPSKSGKLRFDWLTIKVICTWPTMGHCQIFIR